MCKSLYVILLTKNKLNTNTDQLKHSDIEEMRTRFASLSQKKKDKFAHVAPGKSRHTSAGAALGGYVSDAVCHGITLVPQQPKN